jgi:5-methylcytosine-specific restriction endonuclease McrA
MTPEQKAKRLVQYRESDKRRSVEERARNREQQKKKRRENRDEVNAKQRAMWPKYAKKGNAASRRWQENNPDRVKASQVRSRINRKEKRNLESRAYYAANLEKGRKHNKAYRLLHPEKEAAYRLRRIGKLKLLAGNRTGYRAWVRYIRLAESIECLYCGLAIPKGKRHIDHIMPLARGGFDSTENIGPACATCNLQKNATHPLLFYARKASSLLTGLTPLAAAVPLAVPAAVALEVEPLVAVVSPQAFVFGPTLPDGLLSSSA